MTRVMDPGDFTRIRTRPSRTFFNIPEHELRIEIPVVSGCLYPDPSSEKIPDPDPISEKKKRFGSDPRKESYRIFTSKIYFLLFSFDIIVSITYILILYYNFDQKKQQY